MSKAKISTENEGISILEVVFEVCGYTFTKDDITLYTTRYSRKKRGPEIWKNITEYEDLLLHLDEIHSYNDLIPKMKAITVQIPDQREWLLYEEKICPVQSLQSIIETKLAQQYPAGPGR